MNKRKPVLKNAWIIIIILILITYLILYIHIFENVIKSKIQVNTIDSMYSILTTINDAYNNWYIDRAESIERLSENSELIGLTEKLILSDTDSQSLTQSQIQKSLRLLFEPVLENNGDLGFFIINRDRTNLSSSRDEDIGEINLIQIQRPDILDEVFKGKTMMIPPVVSDVTLKNHIPEEYDEYPKMFIATPLIDKNENIIALVTLRINPLERFSQIAGLGRLGETGETYAFDANAVLLTPSRFEKELREKQILEPDLSSIFNLKIKDPDSNAVNPLTVMAEKALRKMPGSSVNGYKDYRGVDVWGIWLWNENLGMGLATEIDEIEALATFNYISFIQRIGLIISSLIITLLLLIITIKKNATRKQIKTNEERLSIALEATNDILFDYNFTNGHVYVNSLFFEIFPLEKNSLNINFEENFIYCVFPEDRDCVRDNIFKVQDNDSGIIKQTFRMTDRNKEILWILARGKIIKENQIPSRIVISLENISEQKKMESELLESQKLADTSISMKNQMIQNISHEIKTPLNSIMGNLYGLKKKSLSADQLTYMEKIEKSSNKLLKLINDIFHFSNSDNTISINEFNLSILLKDLYSQYNKQATEKKLSFSISKSRDIPDILTGDIDSLKIVLNQLVDNAIKFTEEGSVSLNITGTESEMNNFTVEFTVSDSGIGISNSDLSIIKNSFTQADGTISRKYEGIGIGLSIIKEKLKVFGSELVIKSMMEIGTIIHFTIDFRCPEINQFNEIMYSNAEILIDPSEADKKIVLKKPTAEIMEKLVDLTHLCSENNLKAISLLEEMKEIKIKDYFSERWVNLLYKSLSNYDFDKALKLLWEIDSV